MPLPEEQGFFWFTHKQGEDLKDCGAQGECQEGWESQTWKGGCYIDFSNGTTEEFFNRDFDDIIHVELSC